MKFELLLELQLFDFSFYGFELSRSRTADEELHLRILEIKHLTFFQKSELDLSQSEFWIVKFYDSEVIPNFQHIPSSKEFVPHGCTFGDARFLHAT